jgi:hypothetical protein
VALAIVALAVGGFAGVAVGKGDAGTKTVTVASAPKTVTTPGRTVTVPAAAAPAKTITVTKTVTATQSAPPSTILSTAVQSLAAQEALASGAAAKELAHSAQVAAETIATDNGGSYALVTPTLLNTYESTIQVGSGNGNAFIAPVTNTGGAIGTATTYTVTATSTTGDTYSINRDANGTITRSCTPPHDSIGPCVNGSW